MKRIISVLSVFCAIILLSGCSYLEKRDIAETVNGFAEAIEEQKYDDALDYIKPSISKPIRSVSKIIPDKIIEWLCDTFLEGEDGNGILQDISFTDGNIQVNEALALVRCNVKYIEDGFDIEKGCTIHLVKENENWYISDLDFD